MTSLHEKLEGLKKQKDELIASVNMVLGAIQFCEQCIKDESEKPAEVTPTEVLPAE